MYKKKFNIRPTKVENPTYKRWTSDLQKMNIGPTQVEHPTYKCWTSDLQKLNIRPTTVEHPTYKSWTSDLQKLNIRATKLQSNQPKKFNYQNIRPTKVDVIRPTFLYINQSILLVGWTIFLLKLCSTDQQCICPTTAVQARYCRADSW